MTNRLSDSQLFAQIVAERGVEVDISGLTPNHDGQLDEWFISAFELAQTGGMVLNEDTMTEILVEMNIRGMRQEGREFDENTYRTGMPRMCVVGFVKSIIGELVQ